MLFEWAVDLGDVRIEVLAEVVVLEQVLHLRDIAIFPRGRVRRRLEPLPSIEGASSGAHPRSGRGLRRLRITGTRLSGARPGRTLDITIDLTEDPR